MLQLRNQERFPPWFHPCQVGHGRRPPLPSAMRRHAFVQGHELGYLALAASD
jgi:hypothetical protein